MLQNIYLPEDIDSKEIEENTAEITIRPYHPGYGPTVGNALRRVLLSSLPGAAITQMKITDADHEFSSIEGVKEDIVSIMLNLKGVHVSSTSAEPVEIKLTASGSGAVTAKDFETPPEVAIANGDHTIATLTSKDAKLEITCTVEQGRGYVPSEVQRDRDRSIGTIALDAVYTPVQRVSFNIESARVGQDTNYDSLHLTITTDGTITPQEALQQASVILRDHFSELAGDFDEQLTAFRPQEVEPEIEVAEPEAVENTLNLLQLPSRVHNALERVGITTAEQVAELSDEQIQDIPGLGAKAIHDISDAKDAYIKRMNQDNDDEK